MMIDQDVLKKVLEEYVGRIEQVKNLSTIPLEDIPSAEQYSEMLLGNMSFEELCMRT